MQHFISSYGYLAIVLLMMAESACIPVPSELTMPLGGAIAAGAVAGVHLSLPLVIVAGLAGNVIGSYLAWAAGRYGGEAAANRWSRFLGAAGRPGWGAWGRGGSGVVPGAGPGGAGGGGAGGGRERAAEDGLT